MKTRCVWVTDDPLYIDYHDHEWGIPLYDDRQLFEFLILEGMQAGLSWSTILKKRDNYRSAFDQFDPEKMAQYDEQKIAELLANPGIVRNRLKINAAVNNAKCYLRVQQEFGTFKDYIWSFVGKRPRINHWQRGEDPTQTPESDAMSKDLKKRGFKFVGTTICYAYMQATGMVLDHSTDCYRYQEILDLVTAKKTSGK